MKKLLFLIIIFSFSLNSFGYLVLTPSQETFGKTTKFHISLKEFFPCIVFPKTKIKINQIFGNNEHSFGGKNNGFSYSVTVQEGFCEGFNINNLDESVISFD